MERGTFTYRQPITLDARRRGEAWDAEYGTGPCPDPAFGRGLAWGLFLALPLWVVIGALVREAFS